jgi:hypothetical protein
MEDAIVRHISVLGALCSTAFITGALAIGEPVRVNPRDLALQPHRLVGSSVEVRLRCASMGGSHYRCAAPGLRLDLTRLENDEARRRLERLCTGPQHAGRRSCDFLLRFIPDGGRRERDGLTHVRARGDTAEIISRGVGD